MAEPDIDTSLTEEDEAAIEKLTELSSPAVTDYEEIETPEPTAEEAETERESTEKRIEQLARDLGWVPPSEAKLPPGKKVIEDPEQYIKNQRIFTRLAKQINEQLRSENETLKSQILALQAKISELEELQKGVARDIGSLRQDHVKAQRDAALQAINQQIEEALSGDEPDREAVMDLIRKRDELLRQPKTDVPTQPAPESKNDDIGREIYTRAFERWKQENDWYGKDDDLTAYAEGIWPKISQKYSPYEAAQAFQELTERVMAFKRKLERQTIKPSVNEGQTTETSKAKTSPEAFWRSLDPKSRHLIDQAVAMGLHKDRMEAIKYHLESLEE